MRNYFKKEIALVKLRLILIQKNRFQLSSHFIVLGLLERHRNWRNICSLCLSVFEEITIDI